MLCLGRSKASRKVEARRQHCERMHALVFYLSFAPKRGGHALMMVYMEVCRQIIFYERTRASNYSRSILIRMHV
jgi:hypothetical protein